MDAKLETTPNRISPYIPMPALNQPIEQWKGSFQLVRPSDVTGSVDGCVRFRWLPTTAMEFEGGYAGPRIDLDAQDYTLRIDELGLGVPVLITNVSERQICQIRGAFARAATVVTGGSVDRLRFCLVNFPEYMGNPIAFEVDGTSVLYRGRLEFASPKFHCTVDAIHEVYELLKAGNQDVGFIISHVGELKPLQGAIDSKTLEELVDMLHLFFGFLRGACSGPVFPQGFSGVVKTWEQFASWRLNETRRVETWFPQLNPVELNGLFSGFVEKWSNPMWRQPLTSALNWLIEGNSSQMHHETKIIMSQVALELLGWVQLVECQRLYSHKDFECLSAAGRIRCLLHHLNIPAQVPSHMTELASLHDSDAFDGPGIVALLRNALVHANKQKRKRMSSISGLQLWQAGQLALQYVELAILAICGYQGKYARRAWRGWKGEDEECVPWLKDPSLRPG